MSRVAALNKLRVSPRSRPGTFMRMLSIATVAQEFEAICAVLEFVESVSTGRADLICEPDVWWALWKIYSLVVTISILEQENKTMNRLTVRYVSEKLAEIRGVKDVR